MTRTIIVLEIFSVLLLASSCTDKPATSMSRKDIKVTHDANAMRLLNPHAWASTTLTVGGQEFHGVVGSEPFYLDVPKQDAVLFVTRQAATLTTIHLYDFHSRKVTSVEAGAISFGDAIGLTRTDDHDFIESADSNHLSVASVFLWRKTVWHVDLTARKVTHKECFDYDSSNRMTNHVVVRLDEGVAK